MFITLASLGQKSWQSSAGGLWPWIPHKPAAKVSVISRLDWGRVCFKLTYRVVGKVHFLSSSWLEVAPSARPYSFSIVLLTSWQFASSKHSGGETERVQPRQKPQSL